MTDEYLTIHGRPDGKPMGRCCPDCNNDSGNPCKGMTDDNALTRKKLLDKFDIAVHPTKLYASKDDVALAVKKLKKEMKQKFPNPFNNRMIEQVIDNCFPVFKEEKKGDE